MAAIGSELVLKLDFKGTVMTIRKPTFRRSYDGYTRSFDVT